MQNRLLQTMKIRTLTNPFSCIQRFEKHAWQKFLPHFQEAPDVEIGSGSGSFLLLYAQKNPNKSIVGFETRKRMAEQIEQKIGAANLDNAHIFWGNGLFGLEDMFDDNTIDRIFIFHPDPWPKKGHHKRRLINNAFLSLVHKKLKPDGLMYLSTDVIELWKYMTDIIQSSDYFTPTQDETFWNNLYQTRWNDISKEQKRTTRYATFKVIK